MLYFLIDNKDKSIECAKKAVTALPEKQRTADFNSDESYDLLMTLYQLKKDAPNFKKTLEEKISKSSENQKTIKDCISMAYFYLYEKDYEQSEIWCKKAREIDSDDFKALCLLAHLKFLNSSNLSEFYLQQAFNQRKNDSDNSNLSIQAAMYMILVCNPDNAKAAFDNIEISQKINENNCPICDELLAKYIQVTP